MDAERLRELARDCELQAGQTEEHFDWTVLPPELRHAIQHEVFDAIAFVLRGLADVVETEEREAA